MQPDRIARNMSRVIRFDQFLPVEKSKFLSALETAGIAPARFDVSKMEISPPLMPGNVSALVTVKLAASAMAFSYEESGGGSWVMAFEDDLTAGRFNGWPQGNTDSAEGQDLLASGRG